ncbi:CRISPR-associated helicase/endonuclease Cas3 [Pasteurella bettyae]|uniref:CRISPR-associated helicase Cas3 n=1 Tax=Pasteurella bettyae CCUG 2042 TaxID=1095749 RepID=I3DII0_9PAST|nr:CRISPR-associated helicase/endonuclease Cas3 [Pasteurella bettyae]EIJ71523.1 CRISPR-associated helicase Cas3 [Pasteurella bettyae CCUG 2042]
MEHITPIAHIRQSDQKKQTVYEHLTQTAEITRKFANKLDLADVGELLGLMHDFGKYSIPFQKRIHRKNNLNYIDFDIDEPESNLPNKPDHSTAGAQWIYRHLRKFGVKNGIGELIGQILGLCIASHHGEGLIDCLTLDGTPKCFDRFSKDDSLSHLSEAEKNADLSILQRAESLASENLIKSLLSPIKAILKQQETHDKLKEFHLGCLTRFLFSCLIDADRINSSDFENEAQKDIRSLTSKPDWHIAINHLENHLANFAIRYEIDKIRRDISDTCLQRSSDEQGIYTLTVPTGGGKTLASLRYALHHAQKHNLDRIIYIIPYTSIIEQNATTVRDILGEDWILEHHSNIEPEKQTWQDKLLAENWDKPIIFTTMVQFLDAWFGGGTRGARHIHPMTNAVLIFDEIQTLPIKCVHLFCNVLNWLTTFGKSSAILCTATQPLLDKLHNPELGSLNLANNAEIIGDSIARNKLFSDLSRVEIHYKSKIAGWTVDEAGDFLLEKFEYSSSCLFIVNTKKCAQELYKYCKEKVPANALFHLSTNQCSAHRKDLFDKIKYRLKNNEPVICISTQLIEAGVDISMSYVIRALGGLDSIAQAAGRCNRHGEKQGKGQVYVLNLQEPNFAKVLPDIYQGQRNADRIFREFGEQDILQPKAMQQYFNYYFYERSDEMSYDISNSTSGSLLDWLSDNALNVYGNKNKNRAGKIPLLMQSFQSAGRVFQSIDAPTRAIIVPYGKGKQLITDLCGEQNSQEKHRTLAQAQRYSVNVFPNVWEKLQNENVIHKIFPDSEIYYLEEKNYLDEYGLSFDETGEMPFYGI